MVTEEDVFKKDGVRYTYKGKPILEAQVISMRNQAKGFLESELFKMLNLELKHQANLKMYTFSRNEMDVISGKLMLYSWDVIKSKLHNL